MFNSEFLNTIVLIGTIQGLILSCLIWRIKGNQLANRFLASFIFLLALACLNLYFVNQPWYESTPALKVFAAIVPLVIVMPVGPLIYFYVRASVDTDFTFGRKARIHFYSAFLDLLPQIVLSFYGIFLATGLIERSAILVNLVVDYNIYVDIARWLSLTIYLCITVRYLLNLKGISDDKRFVDLLRWLKHLVSAFLVFQGIWLLHLVPYVIPRYSGPLLSWGAWYPLYIPIAFLIYWLGLRGYFFSRQMSLIEKRTDKGIDLPQELVHRTAELLIKAMEQEKVYLDPQLNLSALSAHTGIASRTISLVINREMGKSFTEFVNEYRVAAIREKLLNPGNENWTIVGLAYECGFNSQPTFQRAFKNVTGTTPKEFMLNNRK